MIKEIVVATRSNIETKWAWESIDKAEKDIDFTTRYVRTGLMMSQTDLLSEDQLTITITRVWVSQSAYDEYAVNPLTVEAMEKFRQYNKDNNIFSTKTIEQL